MFRWGPRGLAAPFAILAFFFLGSPSLAAGPGSRAGLVSFQRTVIPGDVPAHLVTALAQDRAGFLWIGTQGGLVRYDGYGFRVHRPDPARPDTLAGGYVRALHAARDGRVWVGTFSGGLSVHDPATETFRRYQHDPRDPASLANNRVEGLAEDAAGRIWVATGEGLDRLDPQTGRAEHFRHDPADPRSLAHDRVRGVLVDRAGRLWVGGRDGLQVWRGEGQGFERVAAPLAGKLVTKLYEDRRGRIWIGTNEHGGAVLDPRTGELRLLPPLSHYWVYGFAEATPGEMWVATFGGGVDVVAMDTLAVVENLRHDPTLESTVGGDRIGAVLRDRAGVVWVGTWGQGLARHDPAARAFRALRHSPSRPEGLSHPSAVRALERRDGTIWVGTNGNGVDILDVPARGLRRIGGHRADPGNPAALSDGSVTCLAEAADGTVWVATLNGVLHRRAPGTDRFERLSEAEGLPGEAIRALTFTPDGALWAGSARGLARIDPRTGKITAFRHDPADPSSLSGSAVEAIARTPDGTLWIGTDNGLNAFDPARGTAVRILRRPGERDSLPDDWIPDLLVASDGRLWVGTGGGAAVLESWDGRTARFAQVSEKIGRPLGLIEALIEDVEGHIWIGPRLRLDPRTWQARELGPADGCAFRNFFIASRVRTRDGSLLFGSPEGLLAVDPRALRPWAYAPPVVVTGLRVGGRERPGAAALARLVLPPEERAFRLEFAALDLTAPDRLVYRYRLEGFEERWSAADSAQRSAAYTRLPPGAYTLRVQGTNRAGVWSPHELRLPVEVTPAFHETAPFRAATLLALAAMVYGVYRWRVHRLRARSRELERLVDVRTNELANRNRELKVAYERIEEASLTDPLTGLRNRRYLEQVIDGDVEVALRRHEDGAGGREPADRDLVFFLIDLDHFKSVNDTWGHVAGDAVLVETAEVLRATFRSSDHLVRWGGEEFLVVARFVDRRDAPKLAEKLRAAVEAWPFEIPGEKVLRRTCSIGFASCPFSPEHPREVPWSQIVDLADCALYAAKRSGRNGWVGIEANGGTPAEVVQRFRTAPGEAAESGEVRVSASAGAVNELQWA